MSDSSARRTNPCAVEPLFLAGPAGPLFALHRPPDGARKTAVLWLPPFAEEMNRSRPMAVALGRALAARGVGILRLDPHGTGDSAGDFVAARWDIWREEAVAGIDWLIAQGYRRVVPLGLRLGACLALDAAARAPAHVARVVLWQPVLRGRSQMTDFLRLRTAAALAGGGGETPKTLRERLARGEILEIGGYPLEPALAAAVETLALDDLGAAWGGAVDWFEVAGDPSSAVPPPRRAVFDRWTAQGQPATMTVVAGPAFWRIEEAVPVPALVARTVDAITAGDA